MQDQTSRMYGIKVKETRDWFDFDDLRIRFYPDDPDGKQWHVTSICSRGELWYDGRKIDFNGLIEKFQEGEAVYFKMMAQYTEEESSLYVNYMYDVIGDAARNPQYSGKDIKYRIVTKHQGYSVDVHKYENGLIVATKEVNSEKIRKYKQIYGDDSYYKAFNLLFDWHGMDPQSGYPQMSFQCISNSDYITYNGTEYKTDVTIVVWQAESVVDYEIIDDVDKHKIKAFQKDTYPQVALIKRKGDAKIRNATVDRNSIFTDIYHDHKDVYYNGHHHKAMYLVYANPDVTDCWAKKFAKLLAITYAEPYWFLMTVKEGLVVNGVRKKENELLKTWRDGELVDISGTYTTIKKRPKAKEEKYDKVVYDIVCPEENTSITVTKFLNEEEKDSVTFTPEDRKVRFHNIEFVLNGTMWTIYSKCDFIKYGNNKYTNNKPILSFPIDDHFHIEINDETDSYVIEGISRYDVKSETLVTTTYRVWTSEIDRTIKIERTCNNKSETWQTVRAYDVIYESFYYNDLIVDFDYYTKEWALISNSDTLYCEGTNFKKGETIAKWNYYNNARFEYISVVTTELDANSIRLTKTFLSGNLKDYESFDRDQEITYDNLDMMKICHSASQGYWEVKSLNDYCWCEGINYTTGMVIFSLKDNHVMEDLTIMYQIPPEEEGDLPRNVRYIAYSTYDVLHDITSLTIDQIGGSDITLSNKVILEADSLLVNKEKAKSLYGYIWQRAAGPGPVPGQSVYSIVGFYSSQTSNKSAFTFLYNDSSRKIKVQKTTRLDNLTNTGQFFRYTLFNQEYLFWTDYIGALPVWVLLDHGDHAYHITYTIGYEPITTVNGVLMANGKAVFRYLNVDYNLYEADYDVDFYEGECYIRFSNVTDLEYEVPDARYFNNTFILSNNSFVCFKLDEFHTNFNIGFRYFNHQIEPIIANGERLNELNSFLTSQYEFDSLATSFRLPCKFEDSIVMSSRVQKMRSSLTEWWDSTNVGTIIARYNISENSMEYYDKYGIKETYDKLYRFRDKVYLETSGANWIYITPNITITINGDFHLYLYQLDSEEDYMNLSEHLRAIDREPTPDNLGLITPTIEIDRLDSEDPYTIRMFQGNVMNSQSVTVGPSYMQYSDKLILNDTQNNNMIIVMNSPYWDETGSNYAWSLVNYGIDEDYD